MLRALWQCPSSSPCCCCAGEPSVPQLGVCGAALTAAILPGDRQIATLGVGRAVADEHRAGGLLDGSDQGLDALLVLRRQLRRGKGERGRGEAADERDQNNCEPGFHCSSNLRKKDNSPLRPVEKRIVPPC